MKKIIKLGIVDDDLLFTEALASLFDQDERFEVVFRSAAPASLKELLLEKGKPDVLLLDLKLGEISGLDVGNLLHESFPELRIVALSSYYKPVYLAAVIRHGFSAFVSKHSSSDELFSAIEKVHETGSYIRPEDLLKLQEFLMDPASDTRADFETRTPLSERENEVLSLVCKQYTNAEIAEKLFLSQRTVEGHRNRIIEKTGVRNTAGLVIWAIANKLIDLSEIELQNNLKS